MGLCQQAKNKHQQTNTTHGDEDDDSNVLDDDDVVDDDDVDDDIVDDGFVRARLLSSSSLNVKTSYLVFFHFCVKALWGIFRKRINIIQPFSIKMKFQLIYWNTHWNTGSGSTKFTTSTVQTNVARLMAKLSAFYKIFYIKLLMIHELILL